MKPFHLNLKCANFALMDIPDQMPNKEAEALFASLSPVEVPEILGEWSGRGISTGHPLDALLGISGWEGKRFISADEVHPLINRSVIGPVSLNPGLMSLGVMQFLNLAKWPFMRQIFYMLCPLVSTRAPRARLRMVTYRGVSSAAMIYDQKAIIDHFRRVDDRRLMGLMDLRGDDFPFFFLLERC